LPESRRLTRMPVYDLETGRVIGRVRRVIVDPDSRAVAGLLIHGRLGQVARCLPFRELHAIGEHAVTVRSAAALAPLPEHPHLQELLRSRRRLYHTPILTEGGRFLGDVDEFTIDPKSGRIEGLLLSGGLVRDLFRGQAVLPAQLVLTIGEDAVIVRDEAETLCRARSRDAGQVDARPHLPPGDHATTDTLALGTQNAGDGRERATVRLSLQAALRGWLKPGVRRTARTGEGLQDPAAPPPDVPATETSTTSGTRKDASTPSTREVQGTA